ncbi:MAG: family 43 glycosylhydrolase [Nitrospira sp.]|nr:family 43 glycosylhydrolase [Nitrospira sp.]
MSTALVLLFAPKLSAAPTTLTNDTIWTDSSGAEIKAQAGGIRREANGLYYWVGMNYYPNSGFQGLRLYSSADLVHWTFVNIILPPAATGDLSGNPWIGRPDIIWNSTTNEYVLGFEWGNHVVDSSRPGNWYAYATSSTLTGTYTYRGRTLIYGNSIGDHSLFKDSDGKVYLLYVGDNLTTRNVTFNITRLSADYHGVDPVLTTPLVSMPNNGREAPSIVKIGSTYYCFFSGLVGWNSSATKYMTATSMAGPWSATTTVTTAPFSSNSFNTQHDFIISVPGTAGTAYLYAGDRWNQYTGVGVGKNAWFPLTFANGVPTINGLQSFNIDAVAGTWSGSTATYSRMRNRLYSEYMRENKVGSDGFIWGTTLVSGNTAFDWELRPDGFGYTNIINRLTGEYLRSTQGTNVVTTTTYNSASWGFQWTTSSDGTYTLFLNRLTGQYLQQDFTTHDIRVGVYSPTSWSFQWIVQ